MHETGIKQRRVWCHRIVPRDLDEIAPTDYLHIRPGGDRELGTYGEGFGGEALVCLMPNDSGKWFVKLATDAGCVGKHCRHEMPL